MLNAVTTEVLMDWLTVCVRVMHQTTEPNAMCDGCAWAMRGAPAHYEGGVDMAPVMRHTHPYDPDPSTH